ncbi:MAG: hypothetical protein AB7T06_16345 [Kofleriaceae bacterium]
MIRLLDLFPNLPATWPARFSRDASGFDFEVGDDEIPAFVTELNDALLLEDVVFGAANEHDADFNHVVAVEAKVRVQPTTGEYIPIADANLPEIKFKLLSTTGAFTHLRIAVSADNPGTHIQIDGLAVSMAFSIGTLMPPLPPMGDPYPELTVGSFTPGQLDTFAVTYRDSAESEVFVHVRVTVDPDGGVVVIPAVPIVLGPCRFLGVLPVQGMFDVTPILSPERARDTYEWLRHRVDETQLLPIPTRSGLLGMRQMIVDPTKDPLKWLWDKLNDSASTKDPTAELVLEDIVMPQGMESFWLRHYQAGIRRNIVDVDDLPNQFNFATAPVRLAFTSDPTIGVIVNYAALRSTGDDDDAPAGWPVTFDAGLFFGSGDSPRNAMTIGIAGRTTCLLSYLRSLDELGTGNSWLDTKLLGFQISVAAARVGYSFADENRSFKDRAVFVLDLVVRDHDASNKTLRLEGLDGKPTQFALEGIGWWFKLAAPEPSKLIPSGVQVVLLDKFRIFIQEIALVGNPNGGHYLAISAGLAVPIGAAGVRRLRFKIGGNPSAPSWGLDGFYFRLDTDHIKADLGGAYVEERRADAVVRELSLTGSFQLDTGEVKYVGGLDFVWGHVKPDAGDEFGYLLASAFVIGRVPLGIFTADSVRALYANDMRPRLEASDLASRDLRYLAWNRRSSPLSVGGDRRLAGWEANNGSWAVGIGLGLNFTAFAEACQLDSFIMVLHDEGEDASVLYLSGDVYLLNNPKPIAYLAVEVDLDNLPNFSALLGVDIGPDQFVTDPPEWLREVARITATIFVGTDPGTFAIGRLDDPKTWATLRIREEVFGTEGWFEVQLCLELSRDAEGFAFAMRFGGTSEISIFHFDFYVGLGFIIATFKTGATIEGHTVWAEAGMAFRIWSWFRFSCKANIEVRGVGPDPDYSLFSVRVEIETPWYLPDLTFKYSLTIGELATSSMGMMRGPLLGAAAFDEAGASFAVHLTPFDGGDDRQAVRSIDQLRVLVPPAREIRVAAAFTGAMAVPPIPTDVTVQLGFAVPVTDAAAIGSPVPQASSNQSSGDLSMKLELIGMTVRRRARFDSNAVWTDLCDRVELPAILDGSGGASPGSFDPLPLTAFWEPVLVNGATAAQRLLLNATTPFSFGTWDPNADDALAEAEPGWPCCTGKRGPFWPTYELRFDDQPLGDPLPGTVRFGGTRTAIHAVRSADVRISIHAGGALPANSLAARWSARTSGTLFRILCEEPAAWIDLYLAWPAQVGGSIVLTALDADGVAVAQTTHAIASTQPPSRLRVAATKPFSTLVCAVRAATVLGNPWIELSRASYVSFAELQQGLRRQAACAGADHGALSGQGKIGFLPNHEYEIELRTRTTLTHPSTDPETVETKEYAYFRTKGLPGLNAVEDVGAEVRPHVASEYPDRRVRLYRDEPVVISFDETFNATVPIASRPSRPASPEHDVLLKLALAVRPTIAHDSATTFTALAADWLTTHRVVSAPPRHGAWRDVIGETTTRGRKSVTKAPRRLRLATLLARPEACDMDSPLVAPSSVLVTEPPLDASIGAKVWPASAELVATVSPQPESDGPFVHREAFDPADLTALSYGDDSGSINNTAWSVTEGALTKTGAGRQIAVLGAATWNHYVLDAAVRVTGIAAGIAIALPPGASCASRGLFALIERDAGGVFLALRRRTTNGAALEQLAREPIEASDAPFAISVTAFDDKVRARVGDVVVEAERDLLRDGCVGLFADGDVAFQTLSVGGLPVYLLPVKTSRYRTFVEHIASFDGTARPILPDALGAVPPATTAVSTLWTSALPQLASVMAPDADPAARDALFNAWIGALAIPLQTDVGNVAVSMYELGNATRLLLLESPEPIPFSKDVSVTLTKLTGGHWPPNWLDDLADTAFDELTAAVALPRLSRPPRGNVAIVRSAHDGQLRVFTGRIEPRPEGGGRLIARRTADVRLHEPGALPLLGTLRPGGVALVDLDALEVLGETLPVDGLPLPPQPAPTLAVLTDASDCRALLIPIRNNAAVPLDVGRWRLSFALDRERWHEVAPASAASRLTATAGITVVVS